MKAPDYRNELYVCPRDNTEQGLPNLDSLHHRHPRMKKRRDVLTGTREKTPLSCVARWSRAIAHALLAFM